MATFNYVTKDNMGATLDHKINQGLVTTVLGTPDVSFMNGGKSFTLRDITVSGFKPHSRGKGWNSGEITDSKTVYTMTQDRDIEFSVDRQDVDETNQELSMANVSRVFIEDEVQPEVDSYRFAVMAQAANKKGNTDKTKLTTSNVYSKLKAAILPLRKYGSANIVGFVSSATLDLLERSTEFTRNITNQNVGQTSLESRVTDIDGVKLVEVQDSDRLETSYNLAEGAKPQSNAVDINYLFVVKQAVIPVVKENAVFMFAPGEHSQGDVYLYQNRLYHDIFIRKSMEDGLFVGLSADIPANQTATEAGGA